MITQAQLKELFDYDAETGNLVWKVDTGKKNFCGKIAGCIHPSGYRLIRIKGKLCRAHRLIWIYHYGTEPKEHIDHINGNGLDNRMENLREATRSENMQNIKKAHKNNSAGLMGAHKHKKKWRAEIRLNKMYIYLGTFDTPEEAHIAYLAKKRELHPFQTIA